ncbi:ribosomal RNA processing protein 1 homolog A-like [Myotis daubentonii]|uniref:ribosomal RNA processing protein 1 homolog A-like n=1 Tax=Myotis daubentonii TaxID=98922 RepID=UPI0028737F92|nr:ribosomal RNA processing protein 1 homolog A-like [Myotis daubentonii]
MVLRVQLSPEKQLSQRLAGNKQVTRARAARKLPALACPLLFSPSMANLCASVGSEPSTPHRQCSRKNEQEDPRADLSSRLERKRWRQGPGADPTAPQEQPRGHGRRGAHKKRRQPQAGARAKVPGCQEPDVKKKWTQKSKK